LFKSFLSVYGNEDSTITIFKKTFSQIDFLFLSNIEMAKTIERTAVNHSKILFNYRDEFDKLIERIGSEIRIIEFRPNAVAFKRLHDFLNTTLVQYQDVVSRGRTIDNVHTNFVFPFMDTLVEQFRNVPYNEEITFSGRKLNHIFEEIKGDANNSSGIFLEIFKDINDSKRKLKKLLKQLRKDFPQNNIKIANRP
jgi:hypothetical protein